MESTRDEEVLVIDDSSQEEPGTGDAEAIGDIAFSQASQKELSVLGSSSQSNNSIRSVGVDMTDLPTSQDSPFVNPTNVFLSTPKWKDQGIGRIRKTEEGFRLSSKGVNRKVVPCTVTKHSNGASKISSPHHNSLEEHTYARKILPAEPSISQKQRSSLVENQEEDAGSGMRSIQLDITATINITYDHNKQPVSCIFSQMSENIHHQSSSLSSGRLADDSDSSHHDSGGGLIKPNIQNSLTSSSSTTVSSASSLTSKHDWLNRGYQSVFKQNLLKLLEIKLNNYSLSYMDKLQQAPHTTANAAVQFQHSSIDNIMKGKEGDVELCDKVDHCVTSTSNSDDNLQPHSTSNKNKGSTRKKVVMTQSSKIQTSPPKQPKPKPIKTNRQRKQQVAQQQVKVEVKNEIEKHREIEVKKEEYTPKLQHNTESDLQCPPSCKFGKDLLVLAKWPADKVYYPAIVSNCFYTDWEYSSKLDVVFCDSNTKLTLSSCNIFPASLLTKQSVVTYKPTYDSDDYIMGIIQQVHRNHPADKKDTCLSLVVQCDEEDDDSYQELVEVPLTSIALNDYCYRSLKKQIGENIITPHKFSKNVVDVCQENLLEGKRKRKGTEVAVQLLLSEGTRKKEVNADSSSKKRLPPENYVDLDIVPEEPFKSIYRKRKPPVDYVDLDIIPEESSKPISRKRKPPVDYVDLDMIPEESSKPISRRRKPPVDYVDQDMIPEESPSRSTSSQRVSTTSQSYTKRRKSPVKEEVVSSKSSTIGEPSSTVTSEKRKRKPKGPYSPPEQIPVASKRSRRAPSTESTSSKQRSVRVKNRDMESIPSTSKSKRPQAQRELVFRHNVVDHSNDSEQEDDDLIDIDISCIGGGDIDYEVLSVTNTCRKSLGSRLYKSATTPSKPSTSTDIDEDIVKRCGPMPSKPIFLGYNFVITHAGDNSYYRNMEKCHQSTQDSTDIEEQFKTPYSFDYERLKNQIKLGGGKLHKHLLSVESSELPRTVLICDSLCQTANYLLAATLGVPVYSHQLIVNACTLNLPMNEALKTEVPLPYGITSSDRIEHVYSKKRKGEPLKEYSIVLASTEGNPRLAFWSRIIKLAGANLFYYTPDRNLLLSVSVSSVIIVDDYYTDELIQSAAEHDTPLVNTRWLVDTLIRGSKKIMLSADLPQYRIEALDSQ